MLYLKKLFFIFLSLFILSSPLLLLKKSNHDLELKNYNILLIGDSRVHAGLAPKIISEQAKIELGLNLSVYNYGIDGTDILHHLSMVRQLLKLNTAQQTKLIVWTPNPLHFDETRTNNRLELLTLADLKYLIKAHAPFELLLDVATMSAFKPWQQRPLAALVVSDYLERAAIRSLPIQTKLFKLSFNHEPLSREYFNEPFGQVPFKVLNWEDRFQRGALAYEKDYQRFRLSEWHLQLATQLAKLVREQGMQLVVLEMPVAQWYQDHLANQPKHLRWRAELKQRVEAMGALYINDSSLYHDDKIFGDPGHMPFATSLEYSRDLAQRLFKNEKIKSKLNEVKL